MKTNKKHEKIVLVLAAIFLTIYLVWRIVCTLPFGYGIVSMICGIIMLICEVLAGIENISHLITSHNIQEPELPQIPKDMYPEVDVFIATHNEPLDVLYKTANGCKHMRYPDQSKVHIWFCDDGNRPQVAELAARIGIGYQGLANNKLAKAGNLNNALSKTSAPLIATFDADMIPTRSFLEKTVPYFFLPVMKKLEDGTWVKREESEIDPKYKVGFIQTPQSFYNPDLFQYNLYAEDRIPNEQDYFFKEINVSRNKTNSPIYAGSNTVISREALELVGGIATGTITEDFETGLHIQEEGYTCYATSTVVAHGLAPDTIDSLIKQRERWGRGCIFSIRRSKVIFDKKISLGARWSYFSCELYWWSFFRRFVFMLAPILFMIFNVPVIICTPIQMLIFWLPCYLMTYIAMNYTSSKIRNSKWSNVFDTALFPYLMFPILFEALGFKKHNFHVTEKKRAVNNESDRILVIPHVMLSILSVIAILKSVGQIIGYESFGPMIVLFWLCVNLYALILAVFFMIGRTNHRMTERYHVEVPAELKVNDTFLYCHTNDISEGGMSLVFDDCIDLPVSGTFEVTLRSHHYEAVLKIKLVSFRQLDEQFLYAFRIEDVDEYNMGEYYQLVYDRHHSLPDYISDSDSFFFDIKDNIDKRKHKNRTKNQRRRNIRIDVKKYLDSDIGKIFVVDYNFRYFVVAPEKTPDIEFGDNIKLYPLADNRAIYFDGELKRTFSSGWRLYFIKNHMEIAFDRELMEAIHIWLNIEE